MKKYVELSKGDILIFDYNLEPIVPMEEGGSVREAVKEIYNSVWSQVKKEYPQRNDYELKEIVAERTIYPWKPVRIRAKIMKDKYTKGPNELDVNDLIKLTEEYYMLQCQREEFPLTEYFD